MNRFRKRPLILVVDDEPTNLKAMQMILQDDYELLFSTKGDEVLDLAVIHQPNLILLDVLLGDSSGFDICKELKAHTKTAHIPVIFVTVLSEAENEEEGFIAGAVDYISKPIKPSIVKARVKTHLSLVRVNELQESQLEIIRRLVRVAEYGTNVPSGHIMRISHYAQALALAHGCTEEWANALLIVSPMHDIGKIGIPESILKKTEPLTKKEILQLKNQVFIGESIIGQHKSPLLKMARTIVLENHENWDGSGYPNRLEGTDISLEGRIVAIVNVFDKFVSERKWSVDEALEYIRSQAGIKFDPGLAITFCDIKSEILIIKHKFVDEKLFED